MINKKTILDDNASIYKKHSDRPKKEPLKKMSKEEKWQYFKDYYLKKVIVSIVIIIGIGYFLNIMVFNKTTDILAIGLFGGIEINNKEEVQEELRSVLEITNEKDVISIKSLQENDRRLFDLMGADAIQLLIMNEDDFKSLSEKGALTDFSTILNEEEYNSLNNKFVMAKVTELDDKGNIASISDEAPYGIKIDDKVLLNGEIYSDEDIYIGILIDSKNTENAKQALLYMIEK